MDESQHRVTKQERVLAVVKPPRHFVEVGRKMLRADLMPRTHDAALQERECGFDRISMNVSVHVPPVTVTDSFVLRAFYASTNHGLWVGWVFICDHYIKVGANVFLNVLSERARLRIFSMEEPQFAASLPQPNHDFFVVVGSVPALSPVLFSAYIGFVHFYRAMQCWLGRLLHRMTNAVAEIPSRAIVDSKHSLELIRAHSLARLAEDECSKEPFGQRQVGIVEDRPS